METSWLSLVPPFITIIAAFVTRRIIVSLVAGIVSGTLIAADFNVVPAIKRATEVIWTKLEFANFLSWQSFNNSWNLFILLFCLILGTLIGMLYRTGGARAYGEWALSRIKTRSGASLATMLLGVIIFFDDYFNCLTIGAVMRPVTDRFRISRAKLAYIIDSTAAPVCILAPVSTWVIEVVNQLRIAGVGKTVPGQPFVIFLDSLFLNSYSWMALFMVFLVSVKNRDFGPMKRLEKKAVNLGDIGAVEHQQEEENGKKSHVGFTHDLSKKAEMRDLTIPLLIFIALCLIFMLVTGDAWVFGGDNSIVVAFQNMHAAKSMFWGGLIGLLFASGYFLRRKLLGLGDIKEVFFQSVRVMFPVVMTLILAWSMGTIISKDLKTGLFLSHILADNFPVQLLPALIFLVSCLVSFSTGTSWGTFAIMIPIAVPLAHTLAPHLMVPMIGALLAGAIYGDHCSPISDTTILSSIGAGCNHMDHVITQMPYSGLVAAVCLVTYVMVGYTIEFGIVTVSILSMLFNIVLITIIFSILTRPKIKKL